ncbi:MAG: hypothetical protein J2P26_03765 [Nocardiopsaceae bacterium]|nr:hypothetical protein [Nocardiopsaceae bacterium]
MTADSGLTKSAGLTPGEADLAMGLADQRDLAPELRMACYSFAEEFGRPPAVVWRVPGTVTLLTSRTGARMTVAAPWGAIVVAAPRDDDVLELADTRRPGEKDRMTVAGAAAGRGPSWASHGLDGARAGASLLVSPELPTGTGVGADTATETAIRRCLDDCASGLSGVTDACALASDAGVPCVALGTARLPLDLTAAGFRLVVIDTRIRGDAVPANDTGPDNAGPASDADPAGDAGSTGGERFPLNVAAAAIEARDLETLGALLTAAHRDSPGGEAQDLAVTAALRAGAAGARAITDGPGRPVLALVPVSRLPDVRAGISSAFAARGLRVPRLLTFTPADRL